MKIELTEWEAQELVEQLSLRKSHWYGKGYLWVRKNRGGENALAVKIVNGLPDNMYSLHARTLSDETSQEEAERYAMWLAHALTSYSQRVRIERILAQHHIVDSVVVAREIAQSVLASCTDDPVQEVEPPPPVVVPKITVARSRYLQNLLKGRNG